MLSSLMNWKLWQDQRGQDFVEYALLAAFVTTSLGVVMPGWIFPSLTHIFSGVVSSLAVSSGGS
jgi:Flp pilus assembly pilin Flp